MRSYLPCLPELRSLEDRRLCPGCVAPIVHKIPTRRGCPRSFAFGDRGGMPCMANPSYPASSHPPVTALTESALSFSQTDSRASQKPRQPCLHRPAARATGRELDHGDSDSLTGTEGREELHPSPLRRYTLCIYKVSYKAASHAGRELDLGDSHSGTGKEGREELHPPPFG